MLSCSIGKDVYVEKPLTLFIPRRPLDDRRGGALESVVLVGTQQRSGPHYRRARELIHKEEIGRISSIRMGSFRNIMPGFGKPMANQRISPTALDWDMWLGLHGTAPGRYNPKSGRLWDIISAGSGTTPAAR